MEGEIIVDGRRRRSWPLELKRQIVEESYGPHSSVCDVARMHDLDPAQIYQWRKLLRREEPSGFEGFVSVAPGPEGCAVGTSTSSGVSADGGRIEVRLCNGRQLNVPMSIEAGQLGRIVQVLERA